MEIRNNHCALLGQTVQITEDVQFVQKETIACFRNRLGDCTQNNSAVNYNTNYCLITVSANLLIAVINNHRITIS